MKRVKKVIWFAIIIKILTFDVINSELVQSPSITNQMNFNLTDLNHLVVDHKTGMVSIELKIIFSWKLVDESSFLF